MRDTLLTRAPTGGGRISPPPEVFTDSVKMAARLDLDVPFSGNIGAGLADGTRKRSQLPSGTVQVQQHMLQVQLTDV